MQHLSPLLILFYLVSLISPIHAQYGGSYDGSKSSQKKPPGKDAILLSNVHSLTLRTNRLTSSRRVSPISQLTCTGPSRRICQLYTIETMRCVNAGYDYDKEDVQWTCNADLPSEFKLGSTDVICEGYRSSDDKWVLKGSCGVEYRLLLTDRGEERFGQSEKDMFGYGSLGDKVTTSIGDVLFFGLTVIVFLLILIPLLADCFGLRRRGARDPGAGWGDFWGGGGPPGPPPPYGCDDTSSAFASRPFRQGWTPGFWTGALGGSALGYGLGRNSNRGASMRGTASSSRYGAYDDDFPSGGSEVPRYSSTYTGTGFGSTRRR